MVHIPYDALIKRLLEKSGLSQVELDKRLAEKLEEFSGLISKEGAAHIVANELQIPITDIANGPFSIKDLKLGMKNINVAGKVLAKYPVTTFNRNGREGRVASVLFADTTGNTRVTFWNDDVILQERLLENDIVLLSDLTVKENRGALELTGTSKTRISRSPAGVDIEALTLIEPKQTNSYASSGGSSTNSYLGSATNSMQLNETAQPNARGPEAAYVPRTDAIRKSISELSVNDAVVEVVGVIVQVFKPASFVVDKVTGKKVRLENGMLADALHHETRYVMNVVIDDGTETVRVVFFGNECQQLVAPMSPGSIKDIEPEFVKAKTQLLGQLFKVTGRVVKNQMYDRLEIIARSFEFNPNPSKELLVAQQIAQKMHSTVQ